MGGDEVVLLELDSRMLVQNGREWQGGTRLAPKAPALDHRDANETGTPYRSSEAQLLQKHAPGVEIHGEMVLQLAGWTYLGPSRAPIAPSLESDNPALAP